MYDHTNLWDLSKYENNIHNLWCILILQHLYGKSLDDMT